jgi:hypothetical protein
MTIEIIFVEPRHGVIPDKSQVIVPKGTEGKIIKLRDLPLEKEGIVAGSLDTWDSFDRGRYGIPVQWIRLHAALIPKHKIGQWPWRVEENFLDSEIFLVEKYNYKET